jgi:hypothetical protein
MHFLLVRLIVSIAIHSGAKEGNVPSGFTTCTGGSAHCRQGHVNSDGGDGGGEAWPEGAGRGGLLAMLANLHLRRLPEAHCGNVLLPNGVGAAVL